MNDALQRTPEDEYGNTGWHLRLDAWRSLGASTGLAPRVAGMIPIEFATDEDDYDQDPNEDNLRHVDWLVEHHGTVLREALLDAALRLYRGYRMEMVDPDEEDDDLPRIDDHEAIAPLVMSQRIYLTSLPGIDLPYIGFDFSCDWDPEHGIGIMTKGAEVVSMPGTQHLDGTSAMFLERYPQTGEMYDENGYQLTGR